MPYTCDNGQASERNVKARLDRGVANEAFLQSFEVARVRHINSVESDHWITVLFWLSNKFYNTREDQSSLGTKMFGSLMRSMIRLLRKRGDGIMPVKTLPLFKTLCNNSKLNLGRGVQESLDASLRGSGNCRKSLNS